MPRLAVKKAAPKKRAVAVRAPARTYVRKAAPMKTVKRAAAPKKSGGSALGSAIGMAIGAALGGPAGAGIGGMVGNAGGKFMSSIFGHGDYGVSNIGAIKENNIALSNSAQAPQFGSGKVACKFVHREFLGDIYSALLPSTFKIESYPLNPGLERTFPWLAGVVGAKFQQYRLNGLTFEFRSMSSDALNSTNTALGSVIMSTDYDSADSTFSSKQEMENTEYGVSCKPSTNMMHAIECARAQTPVNELYIRAFDVPTGKDIRLYDMGRFSIATTGCQGSNVNLGELWVSYDIDCFKAIEQVPQYLTPFAQYTLNNVDATHVLGTSQTVVKDQIGLVFEYVDGTASVILPYTMESGTIFSVSAGILGTSTPNVPTMDIPLITASLDPFKNGNGWQGYAACPYPYGPATSDYKALYTTYKYDGTGTPATPPKLTFAGGVVPANIIAASITVSFMSSLIPADNLA